MTKRINDNVVFLPVNFMVNCTPISSLGLIRCLLFPVLDEIRDEIFEGAGFVNLRTFYIKDRINIHIIIFNVFLRHLPLRNRSLALL